MHTVKFIFVMLMCTMFLGCVSQQAHERAIEELKMTSQNSVQEVSQLQEANKDLEATIEVQEQIKEKNLAALKKELQALYSQVSGLGNLSGATPANFSVGMDDDGVDFDD